MSTESERVKHGDERERERVSETWRKEKVDLGTSSSSEKRAATRDREKKKKMISNEE